MNTLKALVTVLAIAFMAVPADASMLVRKPFSKGMNYMSCAGYHRYWAHKHTGKWISNKAAKAMCNKH